MTEEVTSPIHPRPRPRPIAKGCSNMFQFISPMSIGATAIALTITSAALLFALALSPLAKHAGVFSLVLASAVLEVVLCLPWTLLVIRCRLFTALSAHECRVTGLIRRILPLSLCTFLLLPAAGGVAAAAIVELTKRHYGAIAKRPLSGLLTATITIWTVSVLAQGLFLVSFALALKSKTKMRAPQRRSTINDGPQEMRRASSKPAATPESIDSDHFSETNPDRPRSLSAWGGDSSLRSSFSTLQRPGSSKRALLVRQHSQPRHSARSSSDIPSRRPSHDEGFDTWDTSGVSSQMRETVLQFKPTGKGTGLPTIPGSRSPSPAKALEGPFSDPDRDESPLPQPPVSCATSPPSSPLELSGFTVLFPSTADTPPSSPPSISLPQKECSLPASSRGSRQTSEDHIHPLFRTSSPTPPPSASSNTIVTAAPEAGQLVSQSTLHRIRSGSLPPTSRPLLRSESYTDVSDVRVPLSSASVDLPSSTRAITSASTIKTTATTTTTCPRSGTMHQRKRSASFEKVVIRDLNAFFFG
ncbi:MAG: hypothetical protein Q9163_005186 [Psora crenata]